MPFRDPIKENVWFALLSYEYERHVRDLLQRGMTEGWATFAGMQGVSNDDKLVYLR